MVGAFVLLAALSALASGRVCTEVYTAVLSDDEASGDEDDEDEKEEEEEAMPMEESAATESEVLPDI